MSGIMDGLASARLLVPRPTPALAAVLVVLLIEAIALFVVLPRISDAVMTHYGIGFADDYDRLAYNLASGNGYRFAPDLAETLMREPGYPLFLAGVFELFGYSLAAARVANFLLAIGIALLMIPLARRVDARPAVASVAAIVFLLHPGVIVAEARGGVELLFMFAVVLFVLALYRAVENGRIVDYLIAGALLGVVVLIRSTPILFPALLFVYLLAASHGAVERRRAGVNAILLVFAMVAVMSPWIGRNFRLTGEFVPTSSMLGVSVQSGQYICEHLDFARGFQEIDKDGAVPARSARARSLGYAFKDDYYQYFYRTGDEMTFNKVLLRDSMERYRDHPGIVAKCLSANLFNFWFAGKSWTVTLVNMLVQLPLLLLAAAGTWILIRSRRGGGLIIVGLFMGYLYVVHLPILAQARYSIPLVPFLAIPAGVALLRVQAWLVDALRTRWTIT
ncbi:MAG: glycosyltransferase family 39 protein [Sulfurifustaceae bacterium]